MRRAAPYLLGAAAAAALAAFAAAVVRTQAPPEGPLEVVWDKQACEACRMHLSDARFVVQLHEESGEVRFFDDPGCYFAYEREARPAVHAAYFRHSRENRWLPLEGAAFLPVDASPMDYKLAAVDPGTPGALSPEEARRRALSTRREGP